MIPLLPEGGLGQAEAIPEWNGNPRRPGRLPAPPLRWHRLGDRDTTVYCHDADLTKQGASASRCERPETGAWAYDGAWGITDDFRACGSWLVLRDGKKSEQLAVLDMATGKVVGRHAFPKPPVFACAGETEIAVGSNRLELLQLPGLKSHWQSTELPHPALNIAVTENFLAYRVAPGFDIVMISRPRSGLLRI